MKISTALIDDTVVLRMTGKIMGGPDQTAMQDCLKLFMDNGYTNFLADMEGINWMNSSGLGILLGGRRTVKSSGGDFMLVNCVDRIESLLKITKLMTVFEPRKMPIKSQYFEPHYSIKDFDKFILKQRTIGNLINYVLQIDEGKFKIVPSHSAGIFRIDDPKSFTSGPLIALPSSFAEATRMFWKEEVDEFEYLINKQDIKESELQKFFANHPKFLTSSDYDKLHSGIILSRDSGTMKPDFVLEPIWSRQTCDILELKLPTQRILVGSKNRMGFSAAITKALYQLREYHDYFEDKNNRDEILLQYGISAYKPKLQVVIGRSRFIEPLLRAKAEADLKQLKIITYDDILLRAKRRMLF